MVPAERTRTLATAASRVASAGKCSRTSSRALDVSMGGQGADGQLPPLGVIGDLAQTREWP